MKRRRMEQFRIDEISLVDNPAQAKARVSIVKRVDKRRILTTPSAGHAHSISTEGPEGSRLMMGMTSFEPDANGRQHAHSWVMDEGGNVIIADVFGHTHGIGVMTMDKTTDGKRNGVSETDEEMRRRMEEERKRDEERKRAEKRLTNIIQLSTDEFDVFKSLSGSDADAFLEASPTDRANQIAKSRESDPVVYTSLDGVEYRKSADAQIVALVRKNDELQKGLQLQQAAARRVDLEKRALDEFPNLSGSDEVKANLLGAIESLPESARSDVLKMVKAGDAGLGKAFTRVGSNEGAPDEGSTPEQELQKFAEGFAKSAGKPLDEAMYAEALATAEGRELLKKHREYKTRREN